MAFEPDSYDTDWTQNNGFFRTSETAVTTEKANFTDAILVCSSISSIRGGQHTLTTEIKMKH